MPFVFTEQGIAMLSAVLKSDIAVQRRRYVCDGVHGTAEYQNR